MKMTTMNSRTHTKPKEHKSTTIPTTAIATLPTYKTHHSKNSDGSNGVNGEKPKLAKSTRIITKTSLKIGSSPNLVTNANPPTNPLKPSHFPNKIPKISTTYILQTNF
jgi:hypothetical protein